MRTEKQKEHDAKRKGLKGLVYSESGKQLVPGEWTERASMWMAENPKEMREFLAQRAILEKAFGSRRYLVNPLEMICPLDGPKCQRADVGLKLSNPS